MLYDVFISHASEDKDKLVRPLAEALRQRRVEVWYDEFTLATGASLRRSIDAGLAKSRFGIIVLSPSFFGKAWPEWELNGLVQRHLASSQSVLLPIWHGVDRDAVAEYSPPLADIVSVRSSEGLEAVLDRLLRVIQPEESALVTARTLLLERGYEPPVISDDWWLDVIEAAGYQDNERWYFPIHKMSSTRGEDLGWTVMQNIWQSAGERDQVCQITEPENVLQFIRKQPGLMEMCMEEPERLLEFAPQLAIPGFAGELEERIQSVYLRSVEVQERRRALNETSGSGLTTNGSCPACDECFALRHPHFGDFEAASVACGYVQGSEVMGPVTRAYPHFDYLVWLLSTKSEWLPARHHSYLLRGMKEWAVWPWGGGAGEPDYSSGPTEGAFLEWLVDSKEHATTIPSTAELDLFERVDCSSKTLGLPEPTPVLVDRFLQGQIIEAWRASDDRRAARRRHRTVSQSA